DQDQGGHRPGTGRGAGPAGRGGGGEPDAVRGHRGPAARVRGAARHGHSALADGPDGAGAVVLGRGRGRGAGGADGGAAGGTGQRGRGQGAAALVAADLLRRVDDGDGPAVGAGRPALAAADRARQPAALSRLLLPSATKGRGEQQGYVFKD